MKYNPHIHNRKSVRLRGYDYAAQGAYFLTTCTHGMECIFGNIVNEEMILNEYGKIAFEEWTLSADIRTEVELDAFVVMPNHFHAIVLLAEPSVKSNSEIGYRPADGHHRLHSIADIVGGPRNKSISALMAGYKSAVTTRINTLERRKGVKIWQRSFHDHIIRDAEAYDQIRNYILNNPANWEKDKFRPTNNQ